MTAPRLTAADRFWAKVDRRAPGECWPWIGSLYGTSGYGQGWVRGRARSCLAHRISWELHHGPVPDGLLVLHRCDNRPCVNPAHLFLGDYRDNTRDMVSKGRARFDPSGRGARTHCRNGHEYTIANTATAKNGSRVCRACNAAKARRSYWKGAAHAP